MQCNARLDRDFRRAVYAALAVLFASGALWLLVERPSQTATWLLMAHGAAAMAMLLLLGALVPSHLLPAWRAGSNRGAGVAMAALAAALIVTAFGLYYIGGERLRDRCSDLHIALGLALPAVLGAHVVIGRARRRAARPLGATPATGDGVAATQSEAG